MEEEIKRWTARRKSALVLDIIEGKTNVSEARRPFDLPPFEIESSVEDGKRGWKMRFAPSLKTSEGGLRAMAHVNELAFDPWNAPPLFQPLGNINRARGEVYGASARAWGASPHG